MILSTPYLPAGGEGAWWLACWTAGREVWVQDLAGLVIVLCFWAKHFTFTVFLSNQNPVVQRIDISIRWWITIQRTSVHKTYCAIQRMGLSAHRTTGARSINVFQRNVKEAWWNAGGGGDLARDWHPIQWGIVILLAAPCYIETEISSRWMGHWTQVQTSL